MVWRPTSRVGGAPRTGGPRRERTSTRAEQLTAPGQNCWPPAGSYMTASGQDLMAADIVNRPGSSGALAGLNSAPRPGRDTTHAARHVGSDRGLPVGLARHHLVNDLAESELGSSRPALPPTERVEHSVPAPHHWSLAHEEAPTGSHPAVDEWTSAQPGRPFGWASGRERTATTGWRRSDASRSTSPRRDAGRVVVLGVDACRDGWDASGSGLGGAPHRAVLHSRRFSAVDHHQDRDVFGEPEPTTSCVDVSLVTLTTRGYGDLSPATGLGRLMATTGPSSGRPTW